MGYYAKDRSYVREDGDGVGQSFAFSIYESGVHPDRLDIEHMDYNQLKGLEAEVRKMREEDEPYINYLKKLVEVPEIQNIEAFNAAVFRSMKSNRIIEIFHREFVSKLNEKIFEFKNINSNDKEKIYILKTEIEKMVFVLEKFLCTLKDNDFRFDPYSGMDVRSLGLPEYAIEDLWRIQKDNGFTFDLAIPVYVDGYGVPFERTAKMIPGIHYLYDYLNGKDVQWHHVINYRENELTPYEDYKLRHPEKFQNLDSDNSNGRGR